MADSDQLSAQERMFMTEEELAAMDHVDEDDPDLAAVAAGAEAPPADAPAADAPAGDAPATDPKEGKPAADPKPATDPKPAADGKDTSVAGDDPVTEPAAAATAAVEEPAAVSGAFDVDKIAHMPDPYVDTSVAPAVEDFETKVSALVEKIVDMNKRFEEGDTEFPDASALKREELKLNREIGRLEAQQEQHQRSAKTAQERYVHAWMLAANSFVSTIRAAGGPDYDDPKLGGDLEAMVSVVQQRASRENKSLTKMQTFAEAHKLVQRMNGTAPKPGAKPPPARPTPPVPPSIGGLPQATNAGVTGGEFAHLERLDPLDLEIAIAKMTPDQQRRYLE